MTGQGEKSSSSASAVQNVQFALSHSVISDYIYCPMISYRPLKNKKNQMHWLWRLKGNHFALM